MAFAKSLLCYPISRGHDHRLPGHKVGGHVEKEVGEIDSCADCIMAILDCAEERSERERRKEAEVDKCIT